MFVILRVELTEANLKKKKHFFGLEDIVRNWLPSTQHAVSEIGGKWGTECLNTRFPLPTLLCAGKA